MTTERDRVRLDPRPHRALSTRYPRAIIAIALLFSLVGAYLYLFELEVVATRGALADPDAAFNQRWRDYQEAFEGERDYLVLALSALGEGDSIPPLPDPEQRAAMKGVADRWAARLARRPDLFPEVEKRIDPEALGEYALLYLPHDALESLAERLGTIEPTVEAVAANPVPTVVLGELRRLLSEAEAPADAGSSAAHDLQESLALLETFLRWFRTRVEEPAPPPEGSAPPLDLGPLLGVVGPPGLDPDGYLFVGGGRLLTVLADAAEDPRGRDRYGAGMDYARTALDSALAELPDSVRIEAGLTGEPALEYQEMLTSQRDFARSTGLALILVSLLFMWAFRTLLRPALATLCLGMSIAMTFGVAWLAIGHLNVLAMVFAVILVALGIDFAIHLYAHYRRGLELYGDPRGAVDYTCDTVGRALWLAGIATSIAFFSAYFTDFPGLSELGVIAGSGLLLCLACMYFVFPALLTLVDERWPSPARPRRVLLHRLLGVVEPTITPARQRYLIGVALLTGLGFTFGEYSMDTNLLSLQPSEGSATVWQERLVRTEERVTYALATYGDRPALEAASTALRASPVVEAVESAFPGREEEKRALLAPLCRELSTIEVTEPGGVSVQGARRELFGIRQTLRRFSATGPEAEVALAGAVAEAEGAYRALGETDPGVAEARLSAMSPIFLEALEGALAEGGRLLCPGPLTLAELPGPFRDRFVGSDGTLALRIHPASPSWTTEDLAWFVEGVREVEPAVFGGIVNIYENALAMVGSFVQAAAYSLLAILLLLLAWSRSLRSTLLATLPLLVGVGLLLGLMRWGPFEIRWNLANLFAIPLLIGIGIDGGVHLVQAWREGGRTTFQGSAEAVLMSSLTTMLGFGLLATGEHAGVASLGLIVFLGIGMNLLACLTVLPPVLAWFDPGGRYPGREEEGAGGRMGDG